MIDEKSRRIISLITGKKQEDITDCIVSEEVRIILTKISKLNSDKDREREIVSSISGLLLPFSPNSWRYEILYMVAKLLNEHNPEEIIKLIEKFENE